MMVVILVVVAALNISAAQGQSSLGEQIWMPLVSSYKAPPNPVHQGIATYYDATGAGACGYGESPDDLMVAAMNEDEYENSQACGSYISVTGPKGSVTVRIVDLCPGCSAGHLDLSREAFAQIADLPQGRVNITWQVTSPEIPGSIQYYFKEGSNIWWTAVQIRNHRNPVAKLEIMLGGQWVNVPRLSYNYFVRSTGMGSGPYAFRVTDIYGNTLVDTGIPLMVGGTVDGSAQFPPGP